MLLFSVQHDVGINTRLCIHVLDVFYMTQHIQTSSKPPSVMLSVDFRSFVLYYCTFVCVLSLVGTPVVAVDTKCMALNRTNTNI